MQSVTSVPVVKTLLLTDLVGSTRLMEQFGDARSQEVFAAHDQLARTLLGRFDGREIDKTDGFLLLFDRPIQAVRYALAYQRELAGLASIWGVALAARAGIHLGEVYLRENSSADVALGAKPVEVEGLAKHTVARAAGLAGARQILLTRNAFDLARRAIVGETAGGELPSWLAHGPYLLQGIEEPVEVFEVGIRGFAPLSVPRDTIKARRTVAAGDEATLGWRPAAGQAVPWRHHWLLERKLGDGGFGEVWLARHERTGDGRAFKFCYDAERLRGLQREVTLFRILKHTLGERDDIVRILDWNFKEAPFFLEAEYLGSDLVEWTKGEGGIAAVPLASRLEIVSQVATAMAAAHSVGVIHKDIKPSNVLITLDSGGRPKARLTDFGIGLIAESGRTPGQITMLGFTGLASGEASSAAGTRLYLAPELLEGKIPSIQSDIYALGILLFQLAVGDLSRALAPGWEREIEDPLLTEDIASCVDGDPGKRLRSAFELADRLRHLEHRREERAEAQRKEREAEETRLTLVRTRRRRRLLATVSSVAILFAAAMVIQSRRTAREAARANQEAEVAHHVSEFLVGLFEVADPDTALGKTVTARELLDQGAVRIGTELQGQPDTRATLMDTMGRAYLKLGLLEPGVQLLEGALTIRRQLYGEEHPAVAESLQNLAYGLFLQGDFDRAERLLNETLTLRRELRDRGEIGEAALVPALRHLASIQLDRGRFAEAERLYREVLTILDAHGIYLDPERASTLNDLAVLLEAEGKTEGVEALYEEALAIARRLLGNEHTEIAGFLGNKGSWLAKHGRYPEAAACLEEALAIKRKILGDRHPSVAYTLYKIADLLDAQGRSVEAEPLAREAAEILHEKLPAGHWRIAWADSILGAVLSGQRRFEEAEPLLRDSCSVLQSSLGPRAWQTQETLADLVRMYDAWGRPRDADRYRALQARQAG